MREESEIVLHRRRIVLEDGRYLIFFTFADQENCSLRIPERAEPETKKED
jgi:hypothetical protein